MDREKRRFIYGLVSGIIAVFLTYVYIEGVKERAGISSGWMEVLKTRKDIKKGELITENNLIAVRVPVKFYSPSMVLRKDVDAVLQRRAVRRVMKGDYIFWTDFAREDERISYEVTEGKRLIALAVNDVTSLGFSIKEGDFVDIAVVSRGTARLIIKDAKVKGVRGKKGVGYSTVLLELEPQDVLSFLVGKEEGSVYLLLKNPADGRAVEKETVRVKDIFKGQVEVIKGR